MGSLHREPIRLVRAASSEGLEPLVEKLSNLVLEVPLDEPPALDLDHPRGLTAVEPCAAGFEKLVRRPALLRFEVRRTGTTRSATASKASYPSALSCQRAALLALGATTNQSS